MAAVILHDLLFSVAKLWYFTLASEPAFLRQQKEHGNIQRLVPTTTEAPILPIQHKWTWVVHLLMLKRSGQQKLGQVLKRLLTPDTLHSWGTALRIILLSWALSAWTRASLVLQNRLPVSRLRRARDDEDIGRFAAAYHLVVAYTALKLVQTRYAHAIARLARIVPLNLQAPSTTTKGGLSRPTLKAVVVLGIVFTMVDELLHHLFLQTLIAPRRTWVFGTRTEKPKDWQVHGRPAPKGITDEDCCICYGAGVDSDSDMDSLLSDDEVVYEVAEEPPLPPEDAELTRGGRLRRARSWFRRNMGLSANTNVVNTGQSVNPMGNHMVMVGSDGEFWDFDALATNLERPRRRSTYQESRQRHTPSPPKFTTGDELENFCKFPTHVAHRRCMRRWVESGLSFGNRNARKGCPVCREPLLLALAPVETLPVSKPYLTSLSEVMNPFNIIPIPRIRIRDVVQDSGLMMQRALVSWACTGGVVAALLYRGVVSL